MADVFISYTRENRELISRISDELTELGISVWFDRDLIAGGTFVDQIQSEIAGSKAVLVHWSPGAEDSQFVKSEALYGLNHNKLASSHSGVNIEMLPPPFNIQQTADLTNWDGSALDPNWIALLKRLEGLLERPGLAELETARHSSPQSIMAWAKSYPDDPLASEVVGHMLKKETTNFHERVAQAEIDFKKVVETGPAKFKRGLDSMKREFEDWCRRLESGHLPPHENAPNPLSLLANDGLNVDDLDLMRRERDEAVKNLRELSNKFATLETEHDELKASNLVPARAKSSVWYQFFGVLIFGPIYLLAINKPMLLLTAYSLLFLLTLFAGGIILYEAATPAAFVFLYIVVNTTLAILSFWFDLEKSSQKR